MTDANDGLSGLGDELVLVAWEKRVRVLFNPAMWLYLLLAFGAGACFVGLIFAAAGAAWAGFLMVAVLFGACLVMGSTGEL